ncbi:MAG: T9SS type A sorting domain-containing protein [Paramuribaculum sp.]|nr:T9SS type A sorting domain-containing protein [Paramuribaculum sp.]
MKKTLLLLSATLLAAGTTTAQRLQDGYVTWPASEKLGTYVNAWNGGNGTITVDGKEFVDHNFFISRVKPRTRIQNTATQLRENLVPTTVNASTKAITPGTDKRLIFWVPISDEMNGSQRLNSLADGIFDGEMFSMWSYIDVWGNWNSPYGWTPGNFADICHKNGVGVHGVASVPFGGISAGWSTAFSELAPVDHNAIGKFLYYHGQDGLGYNSEWSGGSHVGNLVSMHADLQEYMKDRNPLWEVMWYGGTWENNTCSFDQGVTTSNYPNLYKSASIFLNYNWQGRMSGSISNSVNTFQKDPFYIYAGMNMQGGEPKSGSNYDLLKDYAYSIGLWGAHSINMCWNKRFSNGGSDLAKQKTYQKVIEQWFGNGPRNPAVKLTPTLNRGHAPSDDWAGMSSMMSERSAINHVIANESFVTFFNIGNGFFFNWRGERQNSNSWHNIGVQDYMPTWRFWFAPAFGQKTITEGSTKLDADFVWDDAYMGGSCLKVSGSADKEYLHLFRTAIIPSANNKIVIRYKLLNGEADINLVTSNGTLTGGNLTAGAIKGSLLTVAESADVCDQSYAKGADGWITKVFHVSSANCNKYKAANGGVGVIALEFKNAKNMELLLGEFGWYPSSSQIAEFDNITRRLTPKAPEITKTRILNYGHTGADIKVIWNMANTKAAGEPVYNSDVNTSVFRMYAQQEGCEPVNMGMTTTWAGICYSVPVDANAASTRVRVGVSAVSEDYLTESPITWSAYESLPAYRGVDLIQVDKAILKADEHFTLSFVDPNHVEAQWTILNSTGAQQWSATGTEVTCPGLPSVGDYTVEVSYSGKTDTYKNYLSVSPDATGALPEIYTMAINGTDTEEGPEQFKIELNDARTFSYTGRDADGTTSRGIEFQGRWVGVNVGTLGIQANKSFSVAAWVYYPEFNDGISNFITIENRAGAWPENNWGYFWSRINKEGKFIANQIDAAWGTRAGVDPSPYRIVDDRIYYRYDNTTIPTGTWTHVALVFEYKEGTNELRQMFYVNGVLQKVGVWMKVNKAKVEDIVGSADGMWSELERAKEKASYYGEDTYEPGYAPCNYTISSNDWIAFGGTADRISSLEGYIDDFQVWGKAMTQDEVRASMTGLDPSNLPADVLGYWDFEEDSAADNSIVGRAGSKATNKSPKAYFWRLEATSGEGQGGKVYLPSISHAGSPQLTGAYPVTTVPTWTAGRSATITGTGTGTQGEADIEWAKPGDYTVELTLSNAHGSDSRTYPVIKVEDGSSAGIGSVEADGDFTTYVESGTIFVEFAQDGDYTVDIYSVSGQKLAGEHLSVTAGQNAQVSIATPGVYLVKVMTADKVVRTVKVLVK